MRDFLFKALHAAASGFVEGIVENTGLDRQLDNIAWLFSSKASQAQSLILNLIEFTKAHTFENATVACEAFAAEQGMALSSEFVENCTPFVNELLGKAVETVQQPICDVTQAWVPDYVKATGLVLAGAAVTGVAVWQYRKSQKPIESESDLEAAHEPRLLGSASLK